MAKASIDFEFCILDSDRRVRGVNKPVETETASRPALGGRFCIPYSVFRFDLIDHEGFDPVEVQAALAASLGNDDHARIPSDRRAGDKSSLEEAGIPPTPGSARARKKRGGRR